MMDFRAIAMGLTFALIWSSAFTSARIIVQSAPPLMISSLRFFIAGCIALAIAFALGQRIKFTRKQWRAIFVFGICQNALYLGLFFVAMQTLEASFASIIASTMPLMVALASAVFLKDRLSPLGTLGVVAGFCGVILIMYNRIDADIDLFGLMICFIGVIALTIATLTVRSASTGDTLLLIVGLQMLVGSAALFVPSFFLEVWYIDWSPRFATAFIYTIIAPGIIATYIWFLLVNRIGATKAATFHFLNPFFGVAIAALILSEQLTFYDVIGVAVIMAGILAVQISRAQR
jgi:drug/metabolite transporter (DMT)-like permease